MQVAETVGGIDVQALLLTLRLALVTTAVLLLVGIPLGYWIARSSRGLSRAVEALVALPLILPPTVLGFYLLVLLGPTTAVGRSITRLFGHTLAFSFAGLVVGSVLYSLPFAVQPIVAGFRSVDPGLLEAAALLGASRWRQLMRISLPLARFSVITGAVLAFTHTVGEFGVVLMIGGSIPGITRTLSISIFDDVQNFSYAAANRTALLLLAISFVSLLVIYARRETSAASEAVSARGATGRG
jgi:molybdate transport system permease protein